MDKGSRKVQRNSIQGKYHWVDRAGVEKKSD